VSTRDDWTQSTRAWLFFFLHLDGFSTPIYTQTIVKWNWWWDTKEGERITTQTPTLPFTPNPSPKKPKNLKPNTLFFFFSTNSWYIDTYLKNLILEAMQVLLGAATLFFCCCRVAAFDSQDLDLRTSIFDSQDLGFRTQTDHVSYLLSSYLKRLTETESNSAAERRRTDGRTDACTDKAIYSSKMCDMWMISDYLLKLSFKWAQHLLPPSNFTDLVGLWLAWSMFWMAIHVMMFCREQK
jgi:hypothetical protein